MRTTLTLLCGLLLSAPAFAQKFEGLAPTPPMGWNSWNTFGTEISEELIKGMAQALVDSGMQHAGYEYVVLDDGWMAHERDANGNLVGDPERFPSGMKALGDFLHEKGFKFGIYGDAGSKTCGGYPGNMGHEYQDARAYASWGVDYLKYDWCSTGSRDPQEAYHTMRDALYAAGRPVVFSLCEWGNHQPWLWGRQMGHLWRTTGDIIDCYDCQAVYSQGFMNILEAQVGLEKHARPDGWNDPDMMEVGNPGLTLTESRTHFTLWAMLAAPLMAGNDVRSMSPEIRDILTDREVIAIDQDPLGKQGYRFMQHPGKQIWAKQLSDGAWAVTFFNPVEAPLKVRVNWNHLSFLGGHPFSVRDVWGKKDLGATSGEKEFLATVPPHDVLLLKLVPKGEGRER